MKKIYYTLEVICHKEGKEDERLINDNGEYKTSIFIKRPYIKNEGIVSRLDSQSVNLFNEKNIFNLNIPSDVESFSLVLFKKAEYSGDNNPLIKIEDEKEIARVGTNLFAFESKCDIVNLVHKNELSNMLKLYAYNTKSYLKRIKVRNIEYSFNEDVLAQAIDDYGMNLTNTSNEMVLV